MMLKMQKVRNQNRPPSLFSTISLDRKQIQAVTKLKQPSISHPEAIRMIKVKNQNQYSILILEQKNHQISRKKLKIRQRKKSRKLSHQLWSRNARAPKNCSKSTFQKCRTLLAKETPVCSAQRQLMAANITRSSIDHSLVVS